MKIVFSEEQIQHRVQEMAHEIARDFGGEPFHAVGILEDGFMFLSDLVRKMPRPVVCQFLKMEMADSHEEGHQPLRNIVYGSPGEVAGKHVLLVNAMVNSGITLDYLIQQMHLKNPQSVRTAALISIDDHRRVDLPLDYVGFPWEASDSERLIGYGMDQNGLYRNLPYVAAVGADEILKAEAGRKQGGRVGK